MYASTLDAEHAASVLIPMILYMHLFVRIQSVPVAGLPLSLCTELSNFPTLATTTVIKTIRGRFTATLIVHTAVRLRTLGRPGDLLDRLRRLWLATTWISPWHGTLPPHVETSGTGMALTCPNAQINSASYSLVLSILTS
ncbi:hypothetical protein XA68_16326 [Ophiocordyceps unilateralis]|uniref:Uncharacterized protein n=1 Tax=Ophiocordyceps unilateralis TaxID=268505 RepID=A0A2A9P5V1_OPHUN|nr:hypothetical protein XA68_16326 [Ophiocordyceps unilateralis]